jgi:CBS domain-containing protein
LIHHLCERIATGSIPVPGRATKPADLRIERANAIEIVLLIENSKKKRATRSDHAWEAAMTVRAILESKGHQIVGVEPGTPLAAAVKVLADRRIGALLVMSRKKIHGILSERDVVRVLGAQGASVLDQPVSTVMTRKVISCRPSDTVGAIMELMTTGKFRHLPVVEDGELVGVISIGDIVKWRLREFEDEQQALQEYIKTA